MMIFTANLKVTRSRQYHVEFVFTDMDMHRLALSGRQPRDTHQHIFAGIYRSFKWLIDIAALEFIRVKKNLLRGSSIFPLAMVDPIRLVLPQL